MAAFSGYEKRKGEHLAKPRCMIRHVLRHHATVIHPNPYKYKGNKEPPHHITRPASRIIYLTQTRTIQLRSRADLFTIDHLRTPSCQPHLELSAPKTSAKAAKMAEETKESQDPNFPSSSSPPQPQPTMATEPTPSTPTSPPPAYQESANRPPLPPRAPTSTQAAPSTSTIPLSTPPPRAPTQPASRGPGKPSMLNQAKAALPKSFGEAKDSAVKYGKFVLDHVKRGEMPWTQWYCCGIVDGHEVCSNVLL
jgi:hypothetical protein